VLVIRSLESGRETVVTPVMTLRGILQWHPDGGSLFAGGEYGGRRGLFQVDIRTAGAIPQLVSDARHFIVSADSTTVYAVEGESSENMETTVRAAIVKTDLGTGVESELYRWIPGDVGLQMWLSPDEREIVFLAGSWPEGRVLMVVSTAGGTPRHLTDLVYRGEPLQGILAPAWTPDGGNIVFFGRRSSPRVPQAGGVAAVPRPENQREQLYRVSAQGGDLELAGLETSFLEQADLRLRGGPRIRRPDGREISFATTKVLGAPAIWVLENFLPTSGGNR